MTERLDDAPPRTWQNIMAGLEEARLVGGLSAAPEPASSRVAAYARKLDRTDETPADLLAHVEREVSEPATRTALDTMRDWRTQQRKEMTRLDNLEAPDTRSWARKQFDGFWSVFPFVAAGFVIIPLRGDDLPELPVVISAGAAVIAVLRLVFVQSGRSRDGVEIRGMLLFPAVVMLVAPIVTAARVLSGDLPTNAITLGAIAAQVISAIAFAILTLRAPTLAQLAERTPVATPAPSTAEDDFYDDIEKRIEALYDAVKEQAPVHLRAALADRDPIVARATRYTVVEAIRVLHEREQIDGDEAEWMLREALRPANGT